MVVNRKDIPQAVFIRAAQPVAGIEIMMKKRGTKDIKKLCNGPGRLTQALGINLDFYGLKVSNTKLYFLDGEEISKKEIVSAPRVNVDYAGEAKNLPLRFYIKNNPFISRK